MKLFAYLYRNKGYSFTITSSTAYDQKFTYGRNIFQSISDIVDEMFQNFLSRPNVSQPILTQYCDGERVTCSNWLSQWGSKYLGDQNYEAIEILRYYYGNNMYINTAEEVSGIPASWPRVDLTIGSTGEKVRQIQEELARISRSYPAIPTVTPDGIYGPATREAVEVFQRVFGLPVTGVIDYRTWYKISEIYVAASPNLFLCSDTRSFSPFRTLFHISFYFASLIPPSLLSPSFLAYPRQIPCRKKHNKQVTAVPRMPALP